jgi:hypothetical protein
VKCWERIHRWRKVRGARAIKRYILIRYGPLSGVSEFKSRAISHLLRNKVAVPKFLPLAQLLASLMARLTVPRP